MLTRSNQTAIGIAGRNTSQQDQRSCKMTEKCSKITRRTLYPEKPRSTSNPRIPFGPSNGSGIFRQYLITIENRNRSYHQRGAHVCNGPDICYDLVTAFSVYMRDSRSRHSPF